ncbi:MAG: lipoyl(octanoyl) transferase LipB, partial [Pseudomonadota bacterium]|nr:lipoyl(octanoyl) transferase LipB [Pseudomonadota bacterium]
MTPSVHFRERGVVEYNRAWREMRAFTEQRDARTGDEIWLLQHPPVYTQGSGCRSLPRSSQTIPVVHSDRGGQMTYHGPGQLIAYVLVDLKRRRLGPRSLVNQLEQAVIGLLEGYGIRGDRKRGAPGVYVDGAKVAALGLRIHNGGSYHGLSLNVAMDLTPYAAIDPCGHKGLAVTQLRDLGVSDRLDAVQGRLQAALEQMLGG